MIRLDTIKVRMDAGTFRQSAELTPGPGVVEQRGHYKDGRRFHRVHVAPSVVGVGRYTLDCIDGSLTVEGSARALLDAYALGIGPDTVGRWIDAGNADGRFVVTPEGLLRGELKRADVFVDLDTRTDRNAGERDTDATVRAGIEALNALGSNPRFRMDVESRTSLRFRTNVRRAPDELGAYGKGPELRQPDGRPFLAAAGMGVYHTLSGCIRAERRLTSQARVKRLCDRGITAAAATLADVFESNARPVSHLFREIMGERGQRDLFDDVERLIDAYPDELGKPAAFSWLQDQVGNRGICEAAGWDWETVRRLVIRVAGSKNAWRAYPDLRAWIEGHAAGADPDARALTSARLDAFAAAIRAAEDRPPEAFVGDPRAYRPMHVAL